jgi:nicotinamidase-related amidase
MTERLILEPNTTALIMVDMQNDFCHPDGFYARAHDQMLQIGLESNLVGNYVGKMKELLISARSASLFIVHTQIVRESDPFNSVQSLHKIVPTTPRTTQEVSGLALVPGSWGADTCDELKPSKDEYIVVKRGFSAFYQTDLEMILRRRGIKALIIAGTVTYACVLHTTFDAHARDFDIILPSDAVASWSSDLQEPTLKIVDLILGTCRPTAETVDSLDVSVAHSESQ